MNVAQYSKTQAQVCQKEVEPCYTPCLVASNQLVERFIIYIWSYLGIASQADFKNCLRKEGKEADSEFSLCLGSVSGWGDSPHGQELVWFNLPK